MSDSEKIKQLQQQLDRLLHEQEKSKAEIHRIKRALDNILYGRSDSNSATPKKEKATPVFKEQPQDTNPKRRERIQLPPIKEDSLSTKKHSEPLTNINRNARSSQSIEQYIGGNLINKIGMVILLIGLGLFVKYAIDKGMFPPTMRVVLGYLSGATLVGLAFRFKEKYTNYSAVLFAGGMAVLYFTSYLAYIFFEPPVLTSLFAFVSMVVFTMITVGVAIRYDQQIIGLLGLVGAYAVPILISTGSENYLLFFIYLATINLGVTFLAAKKKWTIMTYVGFAFTWAVFLSWIWGIYDFGEAQDQTIGWIFSIVFFLQFYTALVLFQIRNKEQFSFPTMLFIIVNALFFYGCNNFLLEDTFGNNWLSLGTFLNGLFHLGVSYFLFKKLEDKKPFLFISTIGIIFLTAAVPFEFKIEGVLILWLIEGTFLFFASRKYKIPTYEVLSYIILGLCAILLLLTWQHHYFNGYIDFPILANKYFLMGAAVVSGIAGMRFINQKMPIEKYSFYLEYIFGGIMLILVYLGFYGEINHFFEGKNGGAANYSGVLNNLEIAKSVWLSNYTLAFLSLVGIVNFFRWKKEGLYVLTIVLGIMLLLIFGLANLPILNHLRMSYLASDETTSIGYFLLRYVFYIFAFLMLYVVWRAFQQSQELKLFKKWFPLFVHGMVLVVLTNELSTLMLFQMETHESSLPKQVGYSILWGVYALLLIFVGFRKNTQLLRVAGMVLFAGTLIKVFLVDLVGISTVSRTIIFIALGVLLLIVSYLYQRFKDELLKE